MGKKLIVVFLGLLLAIFVLYGCGNVIKEQVNPNMSTTPASPPAGTTSVNLSGGSISGSGNSLNLGFLALDQNNQPLTNIDLGNLGVSVYDSYPAALSALEVKGQGVVDATISLITNGANSSTPLAVALTLDKSGSMAGSKIATLEIAAMQFVDLMPKDSQAAIINFDNRVSVAATMTTIITALKNAIVDETDFFGSTAVYDAIHAALGQVIPVKTTDYVRAILAMTDGQDNYSTYTLNQITAEAIVNGIPIYTIGLFTSSSEAASYRVPLVNIANSTTGNPAAYFEIIAGVTGLSAMSVKSLGSLTDLYTKLANALSKSYSVSCNLPSNLVANQQYWAVLHVNKFGTFDNLHVIKPFVARAAQ